MSANRTVKLKKMSSRVPTLVYLKAKYIADSQGMTMEEKITDLLRKDIQYVSSQNGSKSIYRSKMMMHRVLTCLGPLRIEASQK